MAHERCVAHYAVNGSWRVRVAVNFILLGIAKYGCAALPMAVSTQKAVNGVPLYTGRNICWRAVANAKSMYLCCLCPFR